MPEYRTTMTDEFTATLARAANVRYQVDAATHIASYLNISVPDVLDALSAWGYMFSPAVGASNGVSVTSTAYFTSLVIDSKG